MLNNCCKVPVLQLGDFICTICWFKIKNCLTNKFEYVFLYFAVKRNYQMHIGKF